MTDSFAAAVVSNPIFQQAAMNQAKGQMFSALPKFDDAESQQNSTQRNDIIYGIDDEELRKMKRCHEILRIVMLTVSTLMMVTCYVNFANTSNSLAANFLAIYVLFFSTLICCYEIAFQGIAMIMVQNFGFMYNPVGRSIFLIFTAIMLFQLSLMGRVMFGLLLLAGIFQIGINCRHPKFEQYMRITHFYRKEPIAQPLGQPVTV